MAKKMAAPRGTVLNEPIDAELLALPDVLMRRIFGATVFLVEQRLVAFRAGDRLVCQPPATTRDDLLRAGLAGEFEIRPGRGFGGWIALPLDSPALSPDFLAACRRMALERPMRAPRRRRPPPKY